MHLQSPVSLLSIFEKNFFNRSSLFVEELISIYFYYNDEHYHLCQKQ
ncbi:hypothetical protein BACIH_1769 [Bacillus amyloliquefaciens]|nr:hypothetical protein U471_17930 [Bacillus amyloliquefaciens CC178]QEY91726.1 hypothetical protein BACIT_3969 [Bacillus amyloliquefaciens]QEY93509.1 hypothetical protein BACIH_1769 [Bacillus amyloliquefaciens]